MRPPALVVVEGTNYLEFLKRISAILRRDDPTLPDLSASEQAGRLLFIPIGGGEIVASDHRLSDRSFQLYDREPAPKPRGDKQRLLRTRRSG